jgi:DNA adenine methylase
MALKRIPRHQSPVRITGGKSAAVEFLHQHLPSDFDEYREPFLGAGSMALSLMWRNKNAKYWINDANRKTYCFWKNLHETPLKMQRWIAQKRKEHPTSQSCRDLFEWCRASMDGATDFEAGCMWFIQNRITFNGHGGFTDDAHFTDDAIAQLKPTGQLLQSVDLTISNDDYSVLFSSSSRKTLLFLDPPYDLGGDIIYGQLHRDFDHDVFSLVVRESRHKWMLTYNDVPRVRQRFEAFKTTPLTLTYRNRRADKTGKELVITNY